MSPPDYHNTEEYQNRLRKLQEIQDLSISPYPPSFPQVTPSQDYQIKYGKEPVATFDEAFAKKSPPARVSGRIVLSRPMGKNIFAHLQDSTGRIQVVINRDFCGLSGYSPDPDNPQAPKPQKVFEKKFDLGDIIGCEGYLFKTQKGELSILVEKLTLLCKTLLPLPDKHAGLEDKELRYRKRWLDLIANPEVFQTFKLRSMLIQKIREYFHNHAFMEVETPVLQSLYGGAAASPFTTKLNAFNQEMFMRISLEISLKKLMVGGYDRVFEIGKVFRNEGIDRTHNPEFTMLEAYAANWDYNDLMVFVENLFESLARCLNSQSTCIDFPLKGEMVSIDFKAPWKRMSMLEALKTYGKIDATSLSEKEMAQKLLESGEYTAKDLKGLSSKGLLIQALFEAYAEPHLIQPHHIYDHPIETTPLCKPHRDPQQKGMVERFESFIAGKEICNAYSELNDPLLQRSLLEEQASKREAGDEEAAPLDEEFIEAICQGMPPCGGVGIGIDRLVMLFTSSSSIRDVLFFPWMRSKG